MLRMRLQNKLNEQNKQGHFDQKSLIPARRSDTLNFYETTTSAKLTSA